MWAKLRKWRPGMLPEDVNRKTLIFRHKFDTILLDGLITEQKYAVLSGKSRFNNTYLVRG
jgi:hypothetical protein